MITKSQVVQCAEEVNKMFERGDVPVRVIVGARNGGTAIELSSGDAVLRTLAFGTRGEIYRYLCGMCEALALAQK